MAGTLQELIRHMLATSGKSAAQVSRELGNDSNHLSVILSSGRIPRTDLFVRIANACGYSIEVHGPLDMEGWDLYADGGELVADMEHNREDMEQLSLMQEDAREAIKAIGRQEVIDAVAELLKTLEEQ